VAESIVVCFRMSFAGVHAGDVSRYLPRARALTARAEALGAKLVAWSALTLAFAWEVDQIESAIQLAAPAVSDRGDADGEGPEEAWACGIAQGEMEPFATGGESRGDLAWGQALVISLTLARIARAREVLLHESVKAADRMRLLDVRAASDGGFAVRGIRLDTSDPWRPVRTDSRPPPPPNSTFPPIPPMPVVRYRTPSTFDMEEVDPDALAARLMQLTKDALQGSDADTMERWSDGLRQPGEKDSFAERMRAVARMSRGRVGDALRRLRESRTEDASSAVRCQESLALAVGLAFAGRPDEALLEGLDALARARDSVDDKAIAACMAFLAKLFASVNHTEDAAVFSVEAKKKTTIPPPLA